jgi:hypothetical protein
MNEKFIKDEVFVQDLETTFLKSNLIVICFGIFVIGLNNISITA